MKFIIFLSIMLLRVELNYWDESHSLRNALVLSKLFAIASFSKLIFINSIKYIIE